jgi:hypothetical protein
MLHIFLTCCKSMFQWFQLFQSYVAVSVIMLHVASVLSGCCICLTHIFQVMFQMFHILQTYVHSSVSCFRCLFRESWGTARVLGDQARRAGFRRSGHVACLVLWTGCARPHPGSRVPPTRRERSAGWEGAAGTETGAGCVCEVDRGGLRGGPNTCAGRTPHPFFVY